MAAPLLSLAYPRLWRPTSVPTFPVVLDTTQSLAARLGDFVLFGTRQNLGAPAYPPVAVGSANIRASAIGPAGFTPGTLTDYFSVPNRTNLIAGDYGVSLRFQPIAVSADYAVLWDKGTSPISRELSLFVDSSLNINYTQSGPLAISTGMSFGNTYEITLTRTGSTSTVYVNGAVVGTFTDSNTGAFTAATAFGSNISGGGANTSANFIRWATWQNYCPTASDVAQLAALPFGLLRPAVRRQYFVGGTVVAPSADELLFHGVFF